MLNVYFITCPSEIIPIIATIVAGLEILEGERLKQVLP